MQFKDIIGHEAVKANLIHLFNTQRLPHALLFLGRQGVGGLPMAIAFAQYVFCENKQENDSCGVCKSCKQIAKLTHPDLHFSFPTISVKQKPAISENFLNEFREFYGQTPYDTTYNWLQFIGADNKQGNITADECRQIINQLNLTAFEGGYKIQIIWRPEYMGKEGNILLKLIEEPPAKTLIFLVAENQENILNTILSRTQKILLPPIPSETIVEALTQRLKIAEPRARQIAKLSENSWLRALELNQNDNINDWMPTLLDWFNAIFTFNPIKTRDWVNELGKQGREQQKEFLSFAQNILGSVLRIMVIPGYHAPLSDQELSFAQKLAKRGLPIDTFKKMSASIEKSIYHIERNTHSKTELLYLSLQMQYLIQGKELTATPQ